MKIQTAYCTDKGNVKEVNQDALIIKTASTSIGEIAFIAICDGMGGLEKGEMASSMMIRGLGQWFKTELPRLLLKEHYEEFIFSSLNHIILNTNETLMEYGQENSIKVGTTLTAMLMIGTKYFVVHVGDTRLYELTAQEGIQITKDHTLVAMEVEQNKLTLEEAEKDPRKNLLLQCIGASKNLQPDFIQGEVKANATYLICCDGFRHKITLEEMKQAFTNDEVNSEAKLFDECHRLVELNKERAERDNITVVVLQVATSRENGLC